MLLALLIIDGYSVSISATEITGPQVGVQNVQPQGAGLQNEILKESAENQSSREAQTKVLIDSKVIESGRKVLMEQLATWWAVLARTGTPVINLATAPKVNAIAVPAVKPMAVSFPFGWLKSSLLTTKAPIVQPKSKPKAANWFEEFAKKVNLKPVKRKKKNKLNELNQFFKLSVPNFNNRQS